MKRCQIKRLRDKARDAADRISEKWVQDAEQLIKEDPTDPFAWLAEQCAKSTTLDRDFINRLANGDFLEPLDTFPACDDPTCGVCHP